MKYTADSWFFIQLSKNTEKAREIWQSIKDGKGRLVVPTIVIVEIKKRLLGYGLNKYADELIDELDFSHNINIVNLTLELSKEAGRIGNTYKCTTADSVILATAIETDYTNILTDDEHFLSAKKQGKVKIISF